MHDISFIIFALYSGKTTLDVVKEYANDQQKWIDEFPIVLRKMQANGYDEGELKNGPRTG